MNSTSQAPSRAPIHGKPLRIGAWTVDPSLDEIRGADGLPVKLEPRKMQLLLALADRPGQLVTTDELFQTVWKDVVVTPNSIYQSIAQLRKTLGDDADEPRYIATVPRKGYRLVAAVSSPDTAPAAAAPAPASPAPHSSPPDRPWRRRTLIAAGSAAVTAALGGAWLLRPHRTGPAAPLRLAVLPFVDALHPATPDVFAEGLAQEVQAQLERRVGWQVTSHAAAVRLAARGPSLASTGEQLQVNWVLRGRVQRADGRIAADIDLVAPATAAPQWTRRYEGSELDMVRLANEIVQGLERELGIAAQGLPDLPRATRSVAALEELYLGNQQLLRATAESVRSARDHYQRAIEIDPGFARGYAALALGWMAGFNFEGVTLRDALHRAQPLAEKALALDDGLAAAHAVQGFIYLESLRLPDAEVRLRRALELSPNYAAAQFWLAMAAQYDARPLDAAVRFARARLLDPMSFLVPSLQALAFADMGQFTDARAAVLQARQLAPEHPTPARSAARIEFAEGRLDDAVLWYRRATDVGANQFSLWRERGWIEADLGLPDAAAAAFEQALKTQPKLPMFLCELGAVLLAAGARRGLAQVDERLNARLPLSPGAQASWSWSFAARGEPQRALELLRPVAGEILANALPLDGPNDYFLGISSHLDIASAFTAAGDAAAAAPFIGNVERALTRFEQQRITWHGASYLFARIAALRGARDDALARLEQAATRGFRRAWRIRVDPELRALAEAPRFAAVLKTIDAANADARARLARTDAKVLSGAWPVVA